MRTLTIKFVVDDEDVEGAEHEIQKALEYDLAFLPMFCWQTKRSTKGERNWRKRYDKEEQEESKLDQ